MVESLPTFSAVGIVGGHAAGWRDVQGAHLANGMGSFFLGGGLVFAGVGLVLRRLSAGGLQVGSFERLWDGRCRGNKVRIWDEEGRRGFSGAAYLVAGAACQRSKSRLPLSDGRVKVGFTSGVVFRHVCWC